MAWRLEQLYLLELEAEVEMEQGLFDNGAAD